MHLFAKVYLFGSPYTICFISEDLFMLPNEETYKSIGVKVGDSNPELVIDDNQKIRQKRLRLKTTAFFLQPFVKECLNSEVYRANVVNHLTRVSGQSGVVFLKLILEPPDKEVIDYAWNDRMLRLVWSKVEIENAFSWLSTLGGAYSALGDYFEHCAEEAGRISQRQYKLSIMLGDDSLAARSRLYSALSHAQKGELKLARHIVRNVAAFARMIRDNRLNRMCQGVWAKLKYLREISKQDSGDAKVVSVT